jgi:hypothetical protein
MAKIDKANASETAEREGFVAQYEDLEGYTVGFETFSADADPAPLFAGLPDDRCQCPHWGYVIRGKVIYRYADGSEDVIGPGEAYYAPPGHVPVFFADTELVEFSPTPELEKTRAVIMKNRQRMG